MSAIADDIDVDQGSLYVEYVDCFDDAAGTIPTILTGYLGRGQIRTKVTDAEALGEIEVTVIQQPDTLTMSRVEIKILPETTSAITVRGTSYKDINQKVYDIELYKSDDAEDVIRLKNGFINLSPEATKPEAAV